VSGGHFVSREPFDPHSIEALTPAQEKYYLASQWKLMWWCQRTKLIDPPVGQYF